MSSNLTPSAKPARILLPRKLEWQKRPGVRPALALTIAVASVGELPIPLGMGSRSLMARAEQQAYFISAAAAAIGGRLIPAPGGVLVKDAAGSVVGCVGVSGDTSDNDELAAMAGITSVALVPQPD